MLLVLHYAGFVVWYTHFISIPPTHPHTYIHTYSFPSMPCVTVCLGTEQQPCGEMKVKTSHWPLTHLTRFWHCDNWMTILLIWLSLQYMKRIFSWWGKKGRHARSYAARWEGQSENSAQWPQSFSLVMFAGRSLCWLCIITSINVTQDAVPGNKTKIANCQFEYKD